MTVHDKAIRLLEGGIVNIKGDWFRLRKLSDNEGFRTISPNSSRLNSCVSLLLV